MPACVEVCVLMCVRVCVCGVIYRWVVDKVVKRSSHQSVQQASQDSGQDRRGRLEADGLSHMAALPQHMVSRDHMACTLCRMMIDACAQCHHAC